MKESAIAIITNVMSSGIVLIIVLTWSKFILPWFKTLVYRGIKLDGTWKLEQNLEMADNVRLSIQRDVDINLAQTANELSGNATARSKGSTSGGGAEIIYYLVKGEIKDRFVSLSFAPKEQNKIAYSVFLLEVVGDGSILKGYRTFYGYKRKTISALSCKLIKIST